MVRTCRIAAGPSGCLISSESQENLFITRWFALAKKQRRFSRDVATDVDWILNQGRTLGVRARLRHKLDYLWRSCTGELSAQNDLFRLIYALELAKQYDWVYHVLSDSEWSGRRQIQPSYMRTAGILTGILLHSGDAGTAGEHFSDGFDFDVTQTTRIEKGSPALVGCEQFFERAGAETGNHVAH